MSQIGGTLLDHAEKWVDKIDDLHTLRIFFTDLTHALAIHQMIVDKIEDDHAKRYFIEAFATDVCRCQTVILTAQKRIEELTQ